MGLSTSGRMYVRQKLLPPPLPPPALGLEYAGQFSWALRRGHHDPALRNKLCTAKKQGLDRLADTIAAHPDFDEAFRQAYLGGHIQYDLAEAEKAGLAKFVELLKTHGDQPVIEPTFV